MTPDDERLRELDATLARLDAMAKGAFTIAISSGKWFEISAELRRLRFVESDLAVARVTIEAQAGAAVAAALKEERAKSASLRVALESASRSLMVASNALYNTPAHDEAGYMADAAERARAAANEAREHGRAIIE